jgi:hypothetical protein
LCSLVFPQPAAPWPKCILLETKQPEMLIS